MYLFHVRFGFDQQIICKIYIIREAISYFFLFMKIEQADEYEILHVFETEQIC